MSTEKEIEARIDFKMKELLVAVENAAKVNWHIAFHHNSQQHTHYWEAFNQLKSMLVKEIKMATPYNDMADKARRKKQNEAMNKIMKRFCQRGDRDYHQKEEFLARLLDDVIQ